VFSHFELLAPIYDRLMGGLLGPPNRELWARLLELPVNGAMLDVGGGTGRVSEVLRPRVGQLVVCDISLGMLRRAYAKNGLGAVRADAGRLPFSDAVFERVMVTDALHHFRFQQQVIRELGRVLTPGGVLVIEEFDIDRLAIKTLAVLEKITLMGSRFLRAEQIRDLVLATGLKAEIVEGGSLSVLVVAKK
jgi:demethylmenaquinone methyltransferase/2-methoxy-6-polyprenyl-1,4-benzoquinol methylase